MIEKNKILAAIDVGTNSIHMVIVEVQVNIPSFHVIAKEKATVRLGERCAQTGRLKPEAIKRAMRALVNCREMCLSFEVDEIIATATSAVREAPNGQDFLDKVVQETGIEIELISGQEEARRIYLGVISALELNNSPHVIIDIGGGSTELILGQGGDPEYLSSTKVGAVRLTDLFISSDPIDKEEFGRLKDYIQGMLERPTDDLRQRLRQERITMIGTSGTIETLAEMHADENLGSVPNPLQGYELSLKDVEAMVEQLRKLDLDDRSDLVGEKRGEIIVAGALILQQAMRSLESSRLIICERALRDGLIVDWMIKHDLIEDRMRYQGSVRDRSVLKLAHKYGVQPEYGKQVAKLALSLFDQTQGVLHNWAGNERQLLWAAAMLHNCGHHISHSAHHKHSYYLVRNGELLGYTESEVEAIANLCRYHRKSEPKKKHENYRRLTNRRMRLFVDQISPLLRLAVALDRRQISAVAEVNFNCSLKKQTCNLQLIPTQPGDPCTLELWSLEYKKQPFENYYEMNLTASLAEREPGEPSLLSSG
ncbi:Ppx/GppA phosphatase [Thalassoporum mexicanum PCC 7367]|uniref:Ppx/GppA phosphatase family protein n=1 Tax=Thalassoporum mexicanum TaxID=3457544 RepID=UPI00029F9A94|nr:Ppx/GppA phosphatase family protein [Pseudanabaena sp. PCC 7367]AFY68934.1 Ppx/GppA phosphatase [Pseudanabaena sp. PCC 7367]